MSPKITFLASALALSTALATHAQADVIYTVFNPSAAFTLFVYDSPTFITGNPTVLAGTPGFFPNPVNFITSVDFIQSSMTDPGTSELDVFSSMPSILPEELRFYPPGTFTQVGVTPGESPLGETPSFGDGRSMLSVAVPEPGTFGLLGVGVLALLGLLGLRRRAMGESLSEV